jgi:hypothetical protein
MVALGVIWYAEYGKNLGILIKIAKMGENWENI